MTAERPPMANEGVPSEALSNEVLKLKVDDLFQEVEALKRRMALLERQADRAAQGHSVTLQTLSDPDKR